MISRLLVLIVVGCASACGAATPGSREPRAEAARIDDAGTPNAARARADATEDASTAEVIATSDDAGAEALQEEGTGLIEDAAAPPSAVEDVPPATPDEAVLVRIGRQAYARVCADCHEDGPRLTGRPHSSARVRHQVRHGGSRMRAIPRTRLSDRELEGIVRFLGGR